MEMRRVQLVGDKRDKGSKGHEVNTSTFNFENKTYTLIGSRILRVPLYIASAWIAIDSNVAILPER